MEELFYRLIHKKKPKSNDFQYLYEPIQPLKLNQNENQLLNQMNEATLSISTYLVKSIQNFPSLFETNLKTLEETLEHLETISVPNKCVCAGIIETLPGWRCKDCSKYENTIYCHDCYINSKELHKDHKVEYLFNSEGMCDCGDPDSLYTYCSKHSGPFLEQKQIDEYIQKNFDEKVLKNLKNFFDEFFLEFSKYLILTEKCDLFYEDIFYDKYLEFPDSNLNGEKEDLISIKQNFCSVFQNFITFLRLITKKNLGMLHLIANYFLKSNFNTIKLTDEYVTDHKCIEINGQDIKILFDKEPKEKHICKCPFLRLFMSNYRNDISLNSKEDEEGFFFLFLIIYS